MDNNIIEIGDLKIDAPFQATVTLLHGEEYWHITDRHGLNILENNEYDREGLIRYAVDALNDYRPWKYPSRGEWPEKTGFYIVTFESDDCDLCYWYGGDCETEWQEMEVRAWRVRDVPAPVIGGEQ